MKNIMIVDFSNLLMRCHFTFNLTTSDGQLSGTFYGVLKMLENKIKRYNIDECIIAIDKGPYWRKTEFPEYKQGRPGREALIGEGYIEDFQEQVNDLKFVLKNLEFSVCSYPGWEADDIAAALSWKLSKDNKVFLYSGDHDWLQLVRKNVTVVKSTRGGKPDEIFNEENFIDKVGLTQERYTEVLAIGGDKGDGIPSIFGKKIIDGENIYWEDPPRVISENKMIKILSNPYNSSEKLLEGKINPIKGIGKATEKLFLNITKEHKEYYKRNKKLVNLRDGNTKYEILKNNKEFFKKEKEQFNEKLFKKYLEKYECNNIYVSTSFPYFYTLDERKKNTVTVDRNSFLELLKGK